VIEAEFPPPTYPHRKSGHQGGCMGFVKRTCAGRIESFRGPNLPSAVPFDAPGAHSRTRCQRGTTVCGEQGSPSTLRPLRLWPNHHPLRPRVVNPPVGALLGIRRRERAYSRHWLPRLGVVAHVIDA
jgi:hypothetical protein